MWHRIKRFFGFEKPVLPPPALRPVEQLTQELEKLTPDQAVAKLQEASGKAEVAWGAFVANPAATPEQVDELLELVYFCYGRLHPQSVDVVDAAYEQLLERCQQVLVHWLQDGPEALRQLDEYVQRYEESIYLTEAKGQYVLARSEHG
nr:hypothetical protein [Candidatus Doudnabacteria bacterium]